MALICSQVACAEMEQGRVRGEDLDVYSMGGESRSKRREGRNGCWQILFKKQTNAGTPKPAWHSPTTVTEICSVCDFLSTVMTQVHWPLCWLVTFTLRVPCIIFSPCGFSQCISSFWWEFGRSAWQTRVTVCPGSTRDDGSADTRGGETKRERWKAGFFSFYFPLLFRFSKYSTSESSHRWEGELCRSVSPYPFYICKSQIVFGWCFSQSQSCPTKPPLPSL